MDLVHLDVAGLQLAEHLTSLVQPIIESKSLCSVNLTDNSITLPVKHLIFNMLKQPMNDTYEEANSPVALDVILNQSKSIVESTHTA